MSSNNNITTAILIAIIYWALAYMPGTIFFFCLFRAAPMAYGGSQARGPIGAVATSLRQSQSNVESKLRLQPTPQLMVTLDP